MAIDNYENLGFQVNIDGADTVETHLGKIVKRLKQIQQLNKSLGNIGGKSGKGGIGGASSTSSKLTDEERWDKQYQDKMRKQAYYLKQGYVQQKNIISDHTKWVLAAEKKLEKKRFLTEQGYITPKQEQTKEEKWDEQYKNNLARKEYYLKQGYIKEKQILTEEERLRESFEKAKRRRQFGLDNGYIKEKQNLSDIEKYIKRVTAETQKLNDKKYEESRRIELANQQRKKEIDQRLKKELGIKKTTKSLTAYLAKLSSGVMIARRLGHFISGAIQESANYVENLNLFAVAYGDVYEETVDWALNIADAYGLASNEVLKFAGTFRQLSTSLGLVEDTANSVSQTVTQLGYDFSALFNTTVTKSMEALQSSIFSGNVRPLRAFGIDISQNQIDALFETNEALRQLGVNARNLSQSDKVLARLIITLQTGSNAFGTMNREINTLQSQMRILQGSFANFKLAVGDLVQKPIQQALVWVNGLVIAVTNIIRAFHPLQKEDTTPAISNLGEEADEANESLEELNGNLATFDKFNVLNDNKNAGADLTVTEALTAELKKQQDLYQAQLDAMGEIESQAKQMAQSILDWLVILDTEGRFVSFTDNAKDLATAIGAIAFGITLLKSPLLAVTGLFAGVLLDPNNEDLRDKFVDLGKKIKDELIPKIDDFVNNTLPPLIETLVDWADKILSVVNNIGEWLIKNDLLDESLGLIMAIGFAGWISKILGTNIITGGGILALVLAVGELITAFDNLKNGNYEDAFNNLYKSAKDLLTAIGLLTKNPWVITISIIWNVIDSAYKATIDNANNSANPFAAKPEDFGITGDLGKDFFNSLKNAWKKFKYSLGFADGGYTNANLIMTHENGKREWVGKAAGSSAIVNDTQMSDIMEVAVAKGVYKALSARSDGNGSSMTEQPIVIKIGEEAVFNVVKKTAKRQGLGFATV